MLLGLSIVAGSLVAAVAFGQAWLHVVRWQEGDDSPITAADRWAEAQSSVGLFTGGAFLTAVLMIAGVL